MSKFVDKLRCMDNDTRGGRVVTELSVVVNHEFFHDHV